MEKHGSEKYVKNCMQSETFEPFKNLEADLLMKGVNNHANQAARVESLVKDGDDDDVFREESRYFRLHKLYFISINDLIFF